jgi:hypothetical protein
MFTALTENFGNMRSKINSFVALAPVMNLGHSTYGVLPSVASNIETVAKTVSKMGFYRVVGKSLDNLSGSLCYVVPCKAFNALKS